MKEAHIKVTVGIADGSVVIRASSVNSGDNTESSMFMKLSPDEADDMAAHMRLLAMELRNGGRMS